MASQPRTTTQTTQTEPWAGAKPYLQSVYGQYDAALKAGKPETWSGPTVADQSDATTQAYQQAIAAATNGNSNQMLSNAVNANNNLIQNGGANAAADGTLASLLGGINTGTDPAAAGVNSLLNSVNNSQMPGNSVYGNIAAGTNPGLNAGSDVYNSVANANNPTSANLAAMASGANIGNNPYLEQSITNNQQKIADMLKNSTAPTLAGQAAMAGRKGSGAFAQQLNTATGTAANQMAQVATDMYANQYNQDVSQMMNANNQLSNNYNTDVSNRLNAAQNLGNAYNQNAVTQMAGAQGLDANFQNRISNLSNLLGQQSGIYNQGVSNQFTNANLAANSANSLNSSSQNAAQTQANAANNAGNIFNNTLAPADALSTVGAAQDARAQEILNGQIAQWDQNQQMPLQMLANFSNILNGGGYNTQTSTTTQPGNSFLSNLLGVASAGLGIWAKCDVRIKDNIIKIGKSPLGFDMYSYTYIDEPDEIYIGPMAQEVEELYPELVTEFDGIKHVAAEAFTMESIH